MKGKHLNSKSEYLKWMQYQSIEIRFLPAGKQLSCFINMCSWNINGVHNKFKTPDVKKNFQSYDIIIISETHFGVRLRCPEDFICIDRSEPIA